MFKKSALLAFIAIISLFGDNTIGLVRIGTKYGGWTVPSKLLNANSVVYSAGAGEDLSFDLGAIKKYGCKVVAIDPTPRAVDHYSYICYCVESGDRANINNQKNLFYDVDADVLHNLLFLPVGLWNKDEKIKFYVPLNPNHVSHSIVNLQKTSNFFEAECKKLSTIMNELGHQSIDYLKLDIEGAETMVVDNIIQEGIDIKCIAIEYDELVGANAAQLDNIQAAQENVKRSMKLLLDNGYQIIHRKGMDEVVFVKTDLLPDLM